MKQSHHKKSLYIDDFVKKMSFETFSIKALRQLVLKHKDT